MAKDVQRVVVAATPTAALLSHLIHAFSHKPEYEVTFLTRETSITLASSDSHPHQHSRDAQANGHSHLQVKPLSHIKTSFSEPELEEILHGKDILICLLTGSDLHLSGPLIDAASAAKINLVIPSEFGLNTSNAEIRALLPPYRTRYEIQEKLRNLGMNWKAIYSGIGIEDGLKTDGVLGIDVLWASVVVFPGNEETKVAISTYADVAENIVACLDGPEKVARNEFYTSSFRVTIGEICKVTEEELDRTLDHYEGNLEGAKKEAGERMKMGFFAGGVALMGRVAAWDPSVDAWSSWKDREGNTQDQWKFEVKRVVRMVRDGKIGGDGCGC